MISKKVYNFILTLFIKVLSLLQKDILGTVGGALALGGTAFAGLGALVAKLKGQEMDGDDLDMDNNLLRWDAL